jgi:hypothetical protein
MFLLPLMAVATVACGVWWWRSARNRRGTYEAGRVLGVEPSAGAPPWLAADLDRWSAAGLITVEQAGAIVSFETRSAGPKPSHRVSLLAEALGYAGSALALAGAGVALGQKWTDMASWAHLTVAGASACLALAGGWLLRKQEEPAFKRLMSVLWFLTVGGVAWTLVVLGADLLDLGGESTGLLAAGGAAVVAAGLWWRLQFGLQQLGFLAAGLATVVATIVWLPGKAPLWTFALAVWVLGSLCAFVGWKDWVHPGWLALMLGTVGALVGPSIAGEDYGWALIPGLVTAAAVMAVGVRIRETPLLALGTLAAFSYLTWVVVRYFSDSLGVPLALTVVGVIFLALAVLAGRLGRATLGRRPAG